MPEGEERQVFELYYLEGMKQREVADMIGLEGAAYQKKLVIFFNFHTIHIKYAIIKIERVEHKIISSV